MELRGRKVTGLATASGGAWATPTASPEVQAAMAAVDKKGDGKLAWWVVGFEMPSNLATRVVWT